MLRGVYARLSPRGSRTIDRMTNVPGSRRLHRGLVNQKIFSISMSREGSLFFASSPSLFCGFFFLFFLFYTDVTSRARDRTRRSARAGYDRMPKVNVAMSRADGLWRSRVNFAPTRLNFSFLLFFFLPSLHTSRDLSANYPPGVNRAHEDRSR